MYVHVQESIDVYMCAVLLETAELCGRWGGSFELPYLPFSNPHKDLGVIMSSDLTCNDHYRLKHTNPLVSLEEPLPPILYHQFYIYKKAVIPSLVGSQLTYCSIIWRPYLSKHIVLLEKVQKRATKFILNDYSLSYKNRLISIHLL